MTAGFIMRLHLFVSLLGLWLVTSQAFNLTILHTGTLLLNNYCNDSKRAVDKILHEKIYPNVWPIIAPILFLIRVTNIMTY